MAVITPTQPTFSAINAPVVLTSGQHGWDANGSRTTLDLLTKFGAVLTPFVGKRNGSALTRSPLFGIRRTQNASTTLQIPGVADWYGNQTTASNSLLIQTTAAAGATSLTTTTSGTLTPGEIVCVASDDSNANRVEFLRVRNASGATVNFDRATTSAHNANDRLTNWADVGPEIRLPGGDIYHIWPINETGQPLIFWMLAYTLDSETIT